MKRSTLVLFVVILCFNCVSAIAQDDTPNGTNQSQTPTAASLDDLLNMVKEGRIRESEENKKREAEFKAAKAEQQRLLKQARDKKASEERRSRRLEKTFEENELKTSDLALTLEKRLGNLKEMFGVLQQVAGDTRGLFEASLTRVQYPDRGDFLSELAVKMGSTSKLATIDEIEKLWFELQREMTESGKVSRFKTTVITTDGKKEEQEVIRVGAFNIVSNGNYLNFEPATGNLAELARQPQPRFVNTTSDIFTNNSGTVSFGIDPSRGSILGLLVQAPDLRERIDQGGLVGYLIIGLGLIALLVALERLVVLGFVGSKVKSQLKRDKPKDNNPLGRVLMVSHYHESSDRETLELKVGEAVLKETPKLTRALLFLKIISVVAPLMGLLGTVTGMINTFQAITLFGTGDPKLMAGGISQALVTTVLGLSVAIPVVLLHTLVSGRSKKIIHILEEQSAGIIAQHSEKHVASGDGDQNSGNKGGTSQEPEPASS